MINGITYVTVATDASVDRNKQRAGMAYYIRDDDGTTKHAWYLDGSYTSEDAEWLALEAVIEVIAARDYTPATKVIFYCDNQTVLRALTDGFKSKRAIRKWSERTAWIKEKLSGLYIDTRHVKGHTKRRDQKRFYLNYWCDVNARAMVRHARLHVARRPDKVRSFV